MSELDTAIDALDERRAFYDRREEAAYEEWDRTPWYQFQRRAELSRTAYAAFLKQQALSDAIGRLVIQRIEVGKTEAA